MSGWAICVISAKFSEYAGQIPAKFSEYTGQIPAEISECWAEEVENIL